MVLGILKAFRFSENLADLFFPLLRHKFSSLAYVRLVNFNPYKRKKKEQKIRRPRCFEYSRYLQDLVFDFLCVQLENGG
jgi:hypothetical protein